MKLKLVHIVIIGLVILACLYIVKNHGGKNTGGGSSGSPPTKDEMIAQLTDKLCQLEAQIKAKYGENPPDSAKTDPLTLQMIDVMRQLVVLGVRTQPKC